MMKRYLYFLFCLALASCATAKKPPEWYTKAQKLRSQQGQYTKAQALKEFKTPNHGCRKERNREKCVWSFDSITVSGTNVTPQLNGTQVVSQHTLGRYEDHLILWFDRAERLVDWKATYHH